ncbi:MAG: carbamoyltransferase HypF [Campylobacterales bacterium]|nr:carbamoyltransferase HypF [Campylobacterales bacterium]
MIRKSFFINGVVQGVGFRPFVYKLACGNSLCGFVKNDSSGVELEVEGSEENLALFQVQLHSQLPPLARIDKIEVKDLQPLYEKTFEIKESAHNAQNAKTALISPDISTCQECLDDVKNEGKYHNYFATNCTNCGPRYSIIKTVPYDRVNTSMAKFGMCKSCAEEYNNPLSRRYHAQPISCKSCGLTLSLFCVETQKEVEADSIFAEVAEFIKSGKILAIKGIGGFHIVCDATNDAVILRLRSYKNRPTKPLAIMCKNLVQIKGLACVNEKEEELLTSKEAPIVVLKKVLDSVDKPMRLLHFVRNDKSRHCEALKKPWQSKSDFFKISISDKLAPNIDRIGCMLPYTPLHHLLFEHLQNPIVATSANLADEPIITNREDIFTKLPFIDYVLDYNREIINGVDDSLLQVVNGKTQMLRLARGYAPKVIKLPFKSEKKILAVGANAKNSIAFVMNDNIIVSPHIGDLDSLVAFEYFERTIETFKRFYDFEPDILIHDKHPNYETTKWAKKQEKELVEVQHHLAHIYACKAEFGLHGDYLGFSFDGTGYGDGGTLWGGEIFIGDERKYHFKPIKLLGGEKAIKEPRRVALSMLFDKLSLEEVLELDLACTKEFPHANIKMLHQSHTKNLNAPQSSSVGRLFDAIASFADIAQTISYEGESGLLCESFYDENIKECFDFKIENSVIELKIVEFILHNSYDKKLLVSMFINTLVKIIVEISKTEKLEVILSGGVFQNKTLLELATCGLEKENIPYFFQQQTAINDGGIALGQAYYACSKTMFK